MRRVRVGVVLGIAVATLAPLVTVTAASAQPGPRGSGPVTITGLTSAETLPNESILTQGRSMSNYDVSCPSVGNCLIGGAYQVLGPTTTGTYAQGFIQQQVNGLWGTPTAVAGLSALNTGLSGEVDDVSCFSVGNCSIAGLFSVAGSTSPNIWVATETGGVWQNAIMPPGATTADAAGTDRIGQLHCSQPGDCAALGNYAINGLTTAISLSEVNGQWGAVTPLPGLPSGAQGNVGSSVGEAMCPTWGNCTAVGTFAVKTATSVAAQVFVDQEVSGVWKNVQSIPGLAKLNAGNFASATALACTSSDNCELGGTVASQPSSLQPFVASEVNGIWHSATVFVGGPTFNAGHYAAISSLSCPGVNQCVAGGIMTLTNGNTMGFLSNETAKGWTQPFVVPGLVAANYADPSDLGEVAQVSCTAPQQCVAVGEAVQTPSKTSANVVPFISEETAGVWSNAAAVPGEAVLDRGHYGDIGVECTWGRAYCLILGSYSAATSTTQLYSSTVQPVLSAPTPNNPQPLSSGVKVTWEAPVSDGGADIVSYRVQVVGGTQSCTTKSLGCVVSGLHSGTTYRFHVTALNGFRAAATSVVTSKVTAA